MENENELGFKLKPKHTSLCFFILIEIMYGFAFTPLDITGIFHDVLLYSALFMAVVTLFLRRKWTSSQLLKITITLLIGVLVYLLAHETLFLVMIMAAILAGNLGYQKVFKTIFCVRVPMLFVILIGTLMGAFPVGLVMVTKGAYGSEAAYGLGYIHPNCLGQEIYFICSLYICFRNTRIRRSELFAILVIDFFAYYITKSKTACILIAILVLFSWFYRSIAKHIEMNKNMIIRTTRLLCLLLPVLSIGGSFVYTKATGKLQYVLYHLNSLLNGRLSNGSIMYERFPLKLFGMQIDLSSLSRFYSYFIVDNGYIFALFNFGIIPFTFLIFMYLHSLHKLMDKGMYIYAANLVLFLMCVVSENVMRAMFVNFSILFCYELYAENSAIEKWLQNFAGGMRGGKENPLLLVWRK